ncbi:uncharacterized protein SAPINGB_P003794 [Magnusiomyces paraingens]|uniref:Glycerol-3-phosphate dehydrogenase [NAD(+)] n=1 Tax=Magnusiomyces paraingens TaxID=2606893 RepID=A0A5E8BYM4_9ASCO|nr:uncharacterized protein SAPINGB_P003794 [Saprochaete ingens]VVT53875.1 unnamed protein product [Saprochaete ingens]
MSTFITKAASRPFRVCVVGSGNWGTTVAKIVCENTQIYTDLFEPKVNMWVHEEEIDGRKLTEIINTEHENVKYLPGIRLPGNLHAVPNLLDAVRDSNIIVFNIPHQFLRSVCAQLKGYVHPHTRAISCLKGLDVSANKITTLPAYISEHLGIHCGALSGANLAPEIAQEKFSETTVAYRYPSTQEWKPEDESQDVTKDDLRKLFHRPYFHVNVIDDITGVCLAGALKNVVAIAAGFVDGRGWGENAKAAIMRRGLLEMVQFGQTFFKGGDPRTYTEESAGVADLITSCAGGRNHRVGRAYGKLTKEDPTITKTLQDLERELLNGQSAQGILTAVEVYKFLKTQDALEQFPLMTATYRIAFEGESIDELPKILEQVEKKKYKL